MIFSVSNIEETTSIGYELGKLLNAGDIICLTGDLGTGKTHITKEINKDLSYYEYRRYSTKGIFTYSYWKKSW